MLWIDGVLVSPGKGGVYGERMLGEFRIWDPRRSKCAALARHDPTIDFLPDQRVLYLGAAHGTTVSHIADYVEVVYAVEIAAHPMRNLLRVCQERPNIIPIMADARNPSSYAPLVEAVDILYQDVATPSQVDIALDHRVFLKDEGILILMLKTPCMDSRRSPEDLCSEAISLLQPTYRILNTVWLEPYHRDHAAIVAQAVPSPFP
ncbi:MAG: fibrillarin-like rRNA/tRNA 2'-O-methyltransferase [Methanomicrobiales archaeon]|nr:fibrillarin-like rRNA/tRNA 2'-O-methyltransferase [Methanomicrobiales archaeon]